MKYFESLPKIVINENGSSVVRTNLMARASIIPSIFSNPMVFYNYDIQDNDTPEIIAYKYYGNVYRYWLVLFANQILNPQWDWPLNSGAFNAYLEEKYPNTNIYTQLDHYEKIVSITDGESNITTTEVFTISEEEFNNLTPSNTNYTINGVQSTVSVTKRSVNTYEMEFEKNESKRNIKILNSNYVDQVEVELVKLFKIKK